ncbi:MAG: hypothetical protein ABJD97_12115 [Betaproteobacteria bacterium]
MAYSQQQILKFDHELERVKDALDDTLLACVRSAQAANPSSAEYLSHGVGRRIKTMKRCISNVFALLPPSATKPARGFNVEDAQISLQAFVMNVYGVFDNLAWAFVLRHSLEKVVGGRKCIGMFLSSTQCQLPKPLRDYFTLPSTTQWHADYLKSYRDSLAHRIPPYIPPSAFTPDEGREYQRLEGEGLDLLQAGKLDDHDEVRRRQSELGSACFMFIHSYIDKESSRPAYLHPQMICDALTVIEACDVFFKHWHDQA